MLERSHSVRVNCHTHIYSGLVPFGMPEPHPRPANFLQILERVWWRLDRAIDEEILRASARYYAAEALLAGTTTLIDHHESPNFIEGSLDVIADACHELGIRALLCYGATERNGGVEEAGRGLAECRRFIESNDRPDIVGAVALHASFTVSDETIRAAGDLAKGLGAAMHVHLAEDLADVEDARRRGYAGPLERLLELDALPAGSILAHGVHLDEARMERVSARGLWVVQNPRSNRGNGVGYPKALARARNVALGTDGYPANMDDEEEALCEEAAIHGETLPEIRRRIEGGWRLVQERFRLSADVRDTAHRVEEWLESLMVGEREVVKDGRLTGGDIDEIRAHAREQAARLWKRMGDV
jgi:cytosine/adenosine deaminase-related metal-dependent hydrolase